MLQLIPFLQGKDGSVSFVLISPYDKKTVLNFFVEQNESKNPDTLYDMVATAIDYLLFTKSPHPRK